MANELVLLAQWRERLQRLSQSGMTVEAFCRQEGISTSMFYRWQRKLQNPASAATTAPPVGATKTARPLRRKPSRSRRSEIVPGGDAAASLCVEIDSVTLAMMIGGVDISTAKRRKRYRAVAG